MRNGGADGAGVSEHQRRRRRPGRTRHACRWVGYRTPRREPLEPGLILYQPSRAVHVGCEYETWILILTGFLSSCDSGFGRDGHHYNKHHHRRHLLPCPCLSCAPSSSGGVPRVCWLQRRLGRPQRSRRLYVVRAMFLGELSCSTYRFEFGNATYSRGTSIYNDAREPRQRYSGY